MRAMKIYRFYEAGFYDSDVNYGYFATEAEAQEALDWFVWSMEQELKSEKRGYKTRLKEYKVSLCIEEIQLTTVEEIKEEYGE